MSKNMLNYKKILIILGALVMSLAISYLALAWTEPSLAPPDGNVPAPLNVSSTAQTKTGNLIFPMFYDLDTTYYVNPDSSIRSAILKGNVGIGTTNPTWGLLQINNTTASYGVYSYTSTSIGVGGAAGGAGITKYGVLGSAEGTSINATNYGLYGSASGGATNWGLYVAAGRTYLGDIPSGTTSNLLCSSLANSGEIQGCAAGAGGPITWKHYFVTDETHNGDFDNDASLAGGGSGAVNGDGNGVPEATNFCNQSVNRIVGKTYRFADIGSGNIFVPPFTQNNTTFYFNKYFGISGAYYIIGWASPNFFIHSASDNCNNWTVGGAGYLAKVGRFSDSIPVGQVSWSVLQVCGSAYSILCVEQ
jgi:hypothetical protein